MTRDTDITAATERHNAHLADAERSNRADARCDAVIERAWAAGAEAMERLALVLESFDANPVGFAVVAQALASGEVKHPGRGLGPSDDQRVFDHWAAQHRHTGAAYNTVTGQLAIDADTGLPHAGLAAARGVLAIERAAQAATSGEAR